MPARFSNLSKKHPPMIWERAFVCSEDSCYLPTQHASGAWIMFDLQIWVHQIHICFMFLIVFAMTVYECSFLLMFVDVMLLYMRLDMFTRVFDMFMSLV